MKIEEWRIRALPEWARGLPLAQRLAALRGVSQDGMEEFFNPRMALLPQPAKTCEGAAECAQVLFEAIQGQERILVWGDYDADGVCGASILRMLLTDRAKDFHVHLPVRADGFGLRMEPLQQVVEDFKPHLVVCVDCGITACDEIAWLQAQGMQAIVLDHHQAGEKLPKALLCNPHVTGGPWSHLCGAGVAWVVSCLTETLLVKAGHERRDQTPWGVLAGIATVADVMVLAGVNRIIVDYALKNLAKTGLPGLNYLLGHFNIAGQKEASSRDIAFSIAPCINAAGRMDSPAPAYLALSPGPEALGGARRIVRMNEERKEQEARDSEEVQEKEAEGQIVCGPWSKGLVGILAARLVERTLLPGFVLSIVPGGYSGSGRAPDGYNLIEILDKCSECLEEYGGHAKAAGLFVREENLSAFRASFMKILAETPKPENIVFVDAEISGKDLNLETLSDTSRLEPLGEGNARPIFLLRDVGIDDVRTMGQNGAHLRCKVEIDEKSFSGKAWRMGEHVETIKNNLPRADILCVLGPSWPDGKSVDLEIVSMRQVQ